MSTKSIAAKPISCAAGEGYVLSFFDGVATNVCAVASSPDGMLSCVRSTVLPGTEFDAAAALEEDEADPRADVPWAFAMAGAAPVSRLLDALGVPLVERGIAAEELAGIVRNHSQTLSSLDRRALDALASAPSRRVGALAFYSGDGERPERRRQAAASYPLLADLIASNLSAKMAVDRSRPLADVLAQALGGLASREVSKAVLKRAASAPALPDGCSLETIARFMTLVPADWIPGPGPEWPAFCHAAHALLEDLGCPEEEVASLVKGCSGRWDEWCLRVVRKAGGEAAEGDGVYGSLRMAMLHASDMLNCFAHVGVLPMAAHATPSSSVTVTPEMAHAAYRGAYAIIASGRNAADVADLQRRFHQEQERILNGTRRMEDERKARIRGAIEEGGWPALSATVQAPNGLWIVPLTNPAELADEGRSGKDANGVEGLHHCVGTYDGKARSCDCHIVSVRRIEGEGSYVRLSTVEFGPVRDGSDRLTVRQNMGRGNTTPPPEASDAVNWYVAAVAAGVIEINREQIRAFLDKELLPDDGVERLCGYDWRDRDLLNAAVGPWGPFVVPAFRGMGLDAVMESPSVASVTALVPPDILLAAGR